MPPTLPTISHRLAERHEALWLRLSALHKDIVAIAAKKPNAPVGEAVRVTAEGLISDCAPFGRKTGELLPVVARDFSGLAVQLSQALARLDAFENAHAFWDHKNGCRVWRIQGQHIPIARLRQNAAVVPPTTYKGEDMRQALVRRIERHERQIFENGFRKGRAARLGAPQSDAQSPAEAGEGQFYPRVRTLG